MRSITIVLLAGAILAFAAPATTAAPAEARGDAPCMQNDQQGKVVRKVAVEGTPNAAAIVGALRTRVGRPLSAADVAADMQAVLQQWHCVVSAVRVQDVPHGVAVTVVVAGAPSPPEPLPPH